jgi:hypothetical protein
LALLASLTLLGGCAGIGAGIDPCGPWRPILVSRDDALTDATARAVLAHNLTRRRLCGW